MKRFLACVFTVVIASIISAQQPGVQRGKIVAIDVNKRAITLKADGKDIDAVFTDQTKLEAQGDTFNEKIATFKAGADVQFILREKDGKNYLFAMRVFKDAGKKPPFVKVDSSHLMPIDELGDKEYKDGFKGGFYPDGKNVRPKEHEAAGLRLAKEVQPRDADGKADPKGKIVMVSIGMSNTTQASQGFKRMLAGEAKKNPRFLFVDGAVGGMTASKIQDPQEPKWGAPYWASVDKRLKEAGATRAQVQVVWIKEADAGPSQGFPRYAKTLEEELARIVQIFPERFPNVKSVYLSSRTYGGYAITPLNPEPYAYESAFSVKWLVERQIKGEAALNYDPKKGEVKAPWLSWGPYLWANGSKKRADGFAYEEADFTSNDFTHLTTAGQDKVGRLMLRFFQTDTTSRSWFIAQP